MGMFDDLKCKYPLPVPGANELDYQTKDTPEQMLDLYEIREDGTLWHENYDTEDRSEFGKWMRENPGKEPPKHLSIAGFLTRINKRWEQMVDFTGEVRFYTFWQNQKGWIEWSAYFAHGKLSQLNLIENRRD